MLTCLDILACASSQFKEGKEMHDLATQLAESDGEGSEEQAGAGASAGGLSWQEESLPSAPMVGGEAPDLARLDKETLTEVLRQRVHAVCAPCNGFGGSCDFLRPRHLTRL